MSGLNNFEFATRNKLRFPFKGSITVEQLWDLSLNDLDTIYKTINSEKKANEEDSLLSVKNEQSTELDVKIDIVKHIVSVKLAEINARETARVKSEQRQQIMSIIASKKNEELHGKSIDELTEMLKTLE